MDIVKLSGDLPYTAVFTSVLPQVIRALQQELCMQYDLFR